MKTALRIAAWTIILSSFAFTGQASAGLGDTLTIQLCSDVSQTATYALSPQELLLWDGQKVMGVYFTKSDAGLLYSAYFEKPDATKDTANCIRQQGPTRGGGDQTVSCKKWSVTKSGNVLTQHREAVKYCY